MKNQTLENLIIEYLAQVKKATDLLELSFGTKNILRLWRSNKSRRKVQSLTTSLTNCMGLVAVFTCLEYVLTLITARTKG